MDNAAGAAQSGRVGRIGRANTCKRPRPGQGTRGSRVGSRWKQRSGLEYGEIESRFMNGFSWVVENQIAGMARPELRSEAVWAWLAERNIGLVVSLTSAAPDAGVLARYGLD